MTFPADPRLFREYVNTFGPTRDDVDWWTVKDLASALCRICQQPMLDGDPCVLFRRCPCVTSDAVHVHAGCVNLPPAPAPEATVTGYDLGYLGTVAAELERLRAEVGPYATWRHQKAAVEAELQRCRNLLGNAAGAIADHVPWMPTDTKPADAIEQMAKQCDEARREAHDLREEVVARRGRWAFMYEHTFPWEDLP